MSEQHEVNEGNDEAEQQALEVAELKEQKVREIVVPGQELGQGKAFDGTYREGDVVFSKYLGILKKRGNGYSVIPLAGTYRPKIGDKVIGIVRDVQVSGWVVDINAPWLAFMPLAEAVNELVDIFRTDLSRYYDIGDVIYGRVQNVTKSMTIQISMKSPGCRKLRGGVLVKITPSKVRRLIGKGGSMVNLIKEKTKTNIIIGQNGIVWINGENVGKAIEAVLTVDRESHIYGLTEKIAKMLGE